MSDSKQSSNLMAFGFLFTLIAVVALIALILTNSSADTQQNASVTEAPPAFNNDMVVATSTLGTHASSISPSPHSTKTLYVHGTVTDPNGCETIDNTTLWDIAFYSTVLADEACIADEQQCYQPAASGLTFTDCSGPTDTTLTYEFQVPLQYFADAAGWTSYAKVNDPTLDPVQSDTDSTTTTIASLYAINVNETSVEYGEQIVGATYASGVGVTVQNWGNVDGLDPLVSQNNASGDTEDPATGRWLCTVGTMPVTATTISNAIAGTYTAMSNTPTAVDISIPQATAADDVLSDVDFYTKLTIPEGVGGTCSSVLV